MKINNLYPTLAAFVLLLISNTLIASYIPEGGTVPDPKKVFTKQDIEKIADVYLHNNLYKENPVFIDINKDGLFDMLVFNRGVVEYYRNTGTLENPYFVLENSHYDKYEIPPLLKTGMPMPIFFADTRGEGKMDMFAVKTLDFNEKTNKFDYRILHAENVLDMDTGTLITIILVLVIILLVLAILGR